MPRMVQTIPFSVAEDPSHTIAGVAAHSDSSFDVINPSTGRVFATCPDTTREQLELAIQAARNAFPSWRDQPVKKRRERIHAFADALEGCVDELAAVLTLEQGKPLQRAKDEIAKAAATARELSAIPLEPEIIRDDTRGRIELHFRPRGVVGAITPWNVPVILAVWKIVHALYTGNTIVVKPSPYTPFSTLMLGELGRDVFPPGVFNVVAGGNALGQWITEHPSIDKISFTGSSPTGKKIMASAAGSLKRITLELGGNDAAIVLEDANVDAIAHRLFWSAFVNSGQICKAVKRIYVHDRIHDRLAEALAAIARQTKVGDGFDPSVELGPVQNRAQFDIVSGIIADTRRRGGTFLSGGTTASSGGYFVEPTIVTGLSDGSDVVDREAFGPVVPIVAYSNTDEAIRRANATRFGLSASVWSADTERAGIVAGKLEAGTIWVNHHGGSDADIPFGGIKESGMGRENSIHGLREYTEATVVQFPELVA